MTGPRTSALPAPLAALAAPLLAIVALVLPASALADYTGTVSGSTATLTGSGAVVITTSGGLLHHGNLGPGFNSAVDFDSSQPGDQTIADTGGGEVDVHGGGSDSLEIDEGEATNPVSYASGHTFYPNGVPCIVRDPNDRSGIVIFSMHPSQETRICYPSGVGSVTVRAGSGSIQYGVLDTQAGVPLHLFGGPGKNDQFTESADVPSEVGVDHNAASPVYFTPGSGPASITLNDAGGTSPATYTIGSGEILKSGLQPIYFGGGPSDLIELYPQPGPSTIAIGPTGGISTQIFGNFFNQPGPDTIDASSADAQDFITGSLGADTITGSPQGGYIDGGGGNDTIHAENSSSTQVTCAAGSASTVYATNGDSVSANCAHVIRGSSGGSTGSTGATGATGGSGPGGSGSGSGGSGGSGSGGSSGSSGSSGSGGSSTKAPSVSHVRFSPGTVKLKHGAKLKLELTSSSSGTLSVSFSRADCRKLRGCKHFSAEGSTTVAVKYGTHTVSVASSAKLHGHTRTLKPGSYEVTVVLSAGKSKSKPASALLTLR